MLKLVRQAAKFVSVGLVATGVHILVALSLNHFESIEALQANFMAFLVATVFSFLGNWAWTFGAVDKVAAAAPRFLVLSTIAFGLNQSIVFLVTKVAGLPLAVAMVPVAMVVPAFSFWLARTHVFKAHQAT